MWTALGQVYALLRETPAARQALERAYTLQAALPDSAHGREQKAIICRHMGELLKFDAPREALEWLDRGLAAVSDSMADPTAARRRRYFIRRPRRFTLKRARSIPSWANSPLPSASWSRGWPCCLTGPLPHGRPG